MRKFLYKTGIASLLGMAIICSLLIWGGGYVDYFYEKFTVPKAPSMILGDSRSFQGIQPRVMDSYFNEVEVAKPILNYSFTIAQIAYGPLYLESVKRKLDTLEPNQNAVFIITINPWVLSERPEDDYETGVFFEQGRPPHNMSFVSMNPNLEYFFKNFDYFHFKSIIRRSSKLHKDGWLEERNLPKDSITLGNWKENQVRMYTEFSHEWKPSDFRMNALKKTVSYLNGKGNVFILRTPVAKEILDLETKYWPSLNVEIGRMSRKLGVPYFDFSSNTNKYQTYDGNHLDKNGGILFTEELCDSLSIYIR